MTMARRWTWGAVGRVAAVVLAVCAGTAVAAQTRFEPAAIVNDAVITRFDVEQRIRLLGGTGQGGELREAAMTQLIDDRLKMEAARRAGLTPTDAAIREAVESYAAQRNVSVAQLEQALSRGGVSMSALQDALAPQVAWVDVVRRRFGARAEPTATEIEQEAALAAAGQARSWRLSEIAVPIAGRSEAAVRQQAARLVADLRRGANFETTARRASASPSAAQGGDIGWIPEAALPTAAAEAVAATPIGGVTDPIPVPGGLLILKVNERRTETLGADSRQTVTLISVQARGADAAQRVAAVRTGAQGCGPVAEAAEAAGLTVERGEPTDVVGLPPLVRQAVTGLEVGQISETVTAPGAAAVFVVCARDAGLSPQAREAIGREIRQRRLVAFAEAYLQELRSEAVIERR
jgi:peptidyl-prolyl cis-trans isomerase SurA